MALILDWPPEVVARLAAEAHRAGLSIDDYLLRSVFPQDAPAMFTPADEEAKRMCCEEAGRRIVELSKSKSLGSDLTIRELIEDGRRF